MSKITISKASLMDISMALNYIAGLDTKAWYIISKNIKSLDNDVRNVLEEKQEIIKKYAKRDENDKIVYINREQQIVDFGDNAEDADEEWGNIQEDSIEAEVSLFSHNVLEGMHLIPSKIYPLIDYIIV